MVSATAKTKRKAPKGPRLEIIYAAAENAIQSLWHQSGANALTEFRRRRRDKRPSSMEDRLNDTEKRILYGLIEARLCYNFDSRNLGILTAVTLQRTPLELCGVGEAKDLIGESRQMIQYYCEQGHLAAMKSPYDGSWLIVRRAAKEFARLKGSSRPSPQPEPEEEEDNGGGETFNPSTNGTPAGEPEKPKEPIDNTAGAQSDTTEPPAAPQGDGLGQI